MRRRTSKLINCDHCHKWDTDRYLLDITNNSSPLQMKKIFPGRDTCPLEIEIGSGKGTFIISRAQQRPEINFIGIEYAASYAAYTADRVRRAGLENVQMICDDAMNVLTGHIGDQSVLRLHVYFPDPWPKRKHHRRRLVQPPFVNEAIRILKPGGQLLLVTDHREYYQQMKRILTDVPGLANTGFPSLLQDDSALVGTNFEKKYAREGRPFFSIAKLRYSTLSE